MNRSLRIQGFQYPMLADSKWRVTEEHRWTIDGITGRVVGLSFDLDKTRSGDCNIFSKFLLTEVINGPSIDRRPVSGLLD